ncbi:cell wall-recycling L,D-carboxypeptidase ElsL [Acinetobacter sp. ANC 3781]|uniref:cell wall-recycling L,D-carboxypeptidase ElsL n=1 Tax=Acinetobacter sp. ANC 3781 TaxID=2529835 RepID=UPI00104088B2|nr:cell wall-recycling L,D-carboxypeptidase ElsL [Acinetobacter sp. ANC 3781]TCB78406.1 L,D-transpeptidase [Acinetobacter sp. ANC 3781]
MSYTLAQADVWIDLAGQTLSLPKHNKFYVISSGKNGIGEQENSGKTPRGWHKVALKFGHSAPKNAVFKARQETGEVYDDALATQFPERDWILSRILWLSGLEENLNQGEGCDTFKRYIYIHGTPDTEPMGIPMSHGCIRMRNEDVIELFDLIPEQALVFISEYSLNLIDGKIRTNI